MKLFSVVMNATNPAALADFWQKALGGTLTDQGDYVLLEVSAAGPRILFQPVSRHEYAPGRFHLDLDTTEATMASETDRLVAAGARRMSSGWDGTYAWITLADPEENPFCIGASSTERDLGATSSSPR